MSTILDAFYALEEERIISSIDTEFCRFLQEMEPGVDERVLLAACLTSAAYQNGNVCILLDDFAGRPIFEEASKKLQETAPNLDLWLEPLKESTLVGQPGDFKPLILDQANRLYLHKQWKNEQDLVEQILDKVKAPAPAVDFNLLKEGLRRLFGDTEEVDWQKIAAVAAVCNSFTVISGGPGTGKTTTVARLLGLLLEQGQQADDLPSIALAAPTGKAAARLEASIKEAKSGLDISKEVRQAIPVESQTIHQLLGARRYTAHFRYTIDNPLPYDYIIIDEVSMVDQALMRRLMDATLSQTRLLLLGDKDQLASVEAGSVLGDMCGDQKQNCFSKKMRDRLQKLDIPLPESAVPEEDKPLTDHIILLQKSYRFAAESGVGQLANAVNRGEAEPAWNILTDNENAEVSINTVNNYRHFIEDLCRPVFEQFATVRATKSPAAMLEKYRESKILAAHRNGPRGVNVINSTIERLLKREGLIAPYETWYKGRPIIINTNEYTLGLSNGDLGVCGRDEDGNLKVFFASDEGTFSIAPARLPDHATAFALTVHKSQGSEFDGIAFVLSQQTSKILSRELIYTAISRARKQVAIYGNKDVFFESLRRTAARKSGLKDFLWP